LVPRDIDGLLIAGRHISCDPSSHSFLREIPQCWLTGQAAGAAAALAVAEGCAPRAVPIAGLQTLFGARAHSCGSPTKSGRRACAVD
ncbi:MAG TPA: FAD-dependent oxidoreductase, partial [Stellaceae bacterium]|nr:FAD-dependent oxidoreductase [Stellaceae bacterium]